MDLLCLNRIYDDGVTPIWTSSGVLNETPSYDVLNIKYYASGEAACNYDLRIAQNKAILGYGPHITYGRVTELASGGSNGKTVYNYTSVKDFAPTSYKLPPFQQTTVNPYAPGNSLGNTIYKAENTQFKPVREEAVTNSEIQSAVSVNGLKFRFEGGLNTAAKFTKGTYENKFGNWYATTIVSKEYATDAVNYVQRERNLIYLGKRLKEERFSINRNASGYIAQEYYYPDDFTNPTAALQSMIAKNMIGMPVEIVKTVPNGFTNAVTEATYNSYVLDASSRIVMSEIKKAQAVNPITSFQRAWANASGVVDPNYATEITFDKYDSKENLNQSTGKNGIVKSALFDKHNGAPMVLVSNAPWDTFVWSGFENTDPVTYGGVWALTGSYNSTDFATGKRSFTGTVEVNAFPVGVKYIISFWMKGSAFKVNNGATLPTAASWTKYETIVSTGGVYKIETGAGGLVDEVRMYPADAQMVSFGYDHLVGVNTITDINSTPTFTEYDNLWRPHLVKDQKKDIVKRTNYEFEILAPLAYTLNATQTGNYTYQFQVVGGSAGYTYEFNFDDLSAVSSGTATTVSHTFPSLTLTYNVKVKVKNSVNTLATLVKEVTIQKTGGSSVCSEIQNINVVGSTSNLKQVTFSVPNISGASYWWDFGDTTFGTSASEVHVFAPTATTMYPVSVTVSAGGKSCSSKTLVKINP